MDKKLITHSIISVDIDYTYSLLSKHHNLSEWRPRAMNMGVPQQFIELITENIFVLYCRGALETPE